MLATMLAAFALAQQPAPKPFEFKDGDRIVWIGNTLVEREQRYGYWESALLYANKDKNITFRNLGWSGDTVFGDARAAFDTPAKGFERLVSLTLELKPTVIFVSYGTNEAFEGKEGLGKFEKGLEKLLDALAPAKARIVLFTPLPYVANIGFPEFTRRNEILGEYAEVIRKVAESRKCYLADLFRDAIQLFNQYDTIRRKDPMAPLAKLVLTENGMHLTEDGYKLLAPDFIGLLGLKLPVRRFRSPYEPIPEAQPLIKSVVEKNQLFFYRWRPQNETYLFGFRKHEQGKNAKEVAEFDPLVGKTEEEIQKILKTLK
jgi:lysophospholipase L1-like esterase